MIQYIMHYGLLCIIYTLFIEMIYYFLCYLFLVYTLAGDRKYLKILRKLYVAVAIFH